MHAMCHMHDACRKISDIPFPFPWSQVASIMIFIMTVLVPVLATTLSASLALAVCSSFLLIHLLVTIHELAAALEDPFKAGSNQLALPALQKRFNERVLATTFAERPVTYADHSALVPPGHLPAILYGGSSDGTRSAQLPAIPAAPEEEAWQNYVENDPALHEAPTQASTLDKKDSKLRDAVAHPPDQRFLDEASMKERSDERSGFSSPRSSSEMPKAAGILAETMHEPLQFGFDEDDGCVGGSSDDTIVATDTETHALQSPAGAVSDIKDADLTRESHRRWIQSHCCDSTATVAYDSPTQDPRASTHGSHALDVIITRQGSDALLAASKRSPPRMQSASSPLREEQRAGSRQSTRGSPSLQWSQAGERAEDVEHNSEGEGVDESERLRRVQADKVGQQGTGTKISVVQRRSIEAQIREGSVGGKGPLRGDAASPAEHALVQLSREIVQSEVLPPQSSVYSCWHAKSVVHACLQDSCLHALLTTAA
jgi:hypothetical protein